MLSIGNGYDLHPLRSGRKLVLGGVEVVYHLGLAGHSDADVLLHAVMDALLGAARQGDIGKQFPPSDPAFKGADSLFLLKKVGEILAAGGWSVKSIDSVIVCQRPRLSEYIPLMREKITACLEVPPETVGVKATTTEGIGPEGKGEAISAHAVALIEGG